MKTLLKSWQAERAPYNPKRHAQLHCRAAGPAALLILTVLLSIAPHTQAEEQTFYSFDDHSFPWKKNVQLTMVKPEKHANNPVLPRGPKGSIDEWAAQFYGSVLRHDKKFKMWYIAADDKSLELIKKGKGFSGLRPAYAESKDGIHWEKPNLGLVEHNGNKQNNLVLIDPPEVSGIHLIVIHEKDEKDPSRQFKMLLTVSASIGKGKGSSSITLFSPDGLSWRSAKPVHFEGGFVREEDLIMPVTNYEQGGLFRWKGMYHLPGQQFSPTITQLDGKPVGRAMVTFRSPDLISWESASALGFIRGSAIGKVGKPHVDEEAHLASSIWHRNNILLGVYGLWHGAKNWQDRAIELGLMISNDGIHFREPIRDYVLISRGKEGEWDQGGLLQGQGFANVGDKSYIYYGAWDLTKPTYPPRGGVGLVTLRRDGFAYLSKQRKDTSAKFETHLLEPSKSGSRLFINVDQVSKESPVLVELLDEKNQPLPNYSGSQSAVISVSGIHQELIWPKSKSSNIPLTQPYTVRVKLPLKGSTRFYALYLD